MDFLFLFPFPGNLYLQAEENGCLDIEQITVILSEDCCSGDNIIIPNAFTPNSDGLNDYFLPAQSKVTEYKMYIFNVLGELIFLSNDISIGWDGSYKGKIVEDTYFYKIEFNKDDNLIVQTGKFVLLK